MVIIGFSLASDFDVLLFGILMATFPSLVTPLANLTFDFRIIVTGPGNIFSIISLFFSVIKQYFLTNSLLFTQILNPFSFLPFILNKLSTDS